MASPSRISTTVRRRSEVLERTRRAQCYAMGRGLDDIAPLDDIARLRDIAGMTSSIRSRPKATFVPYMTFVSIDDVRN